MTKPQPLALKAVIPNTGNPIAFAGGDGEAGKLVLLFLRRIPRSRGRWSCGARS